VNLLQTWLLVGVPGLLIAAGLFVGRSQVRAWIGYVVLLALALVFALTPGGGLSSALVGGIVVVFVATGRGTHVDDEFPEHHEERRRFTTADVPRD
jgi:multisubunit Na+/H+ antiporter MnhB subunit